MEERVEVAAYEDDEAGVCWLPAELWAMVCDYLGTADLARLSTTCWTLRSHALAKVRHHTFTPLGLVTRRRSMRQALAFVATWPALESLSLSSWDAFPDALLAHLPEALEGLDLSYTSITNRGLARLPVGLTSLDLSGTQVTGAGLCALSRLSSLRELRLAGITGLSARHLEALPASVEVLDLANCSGPFYEGELGIAESNSGFQLALPRVPWPPALRELKLTGACLSLGLLYVPVDMDACLPRLQTLRADDAAFHWRWTSSNTQSPIWSLPSGLKSLSLVAMPYIELLVAFLPASITSLDLSRTSLAERQFTDAETQSWANPFLSQTSASRALAAGWFDTLPKRLPHLRLLNLTVMWAGRDPLCLEIMQENNVTVIFRNARGVPGQPVQREPVPDPVPREQDPKWAYFINVCGETQQRIIWHDLPPAKTPDDHDHGKDDEHEEHKEDDDDEEDEEQGSLLFMGF